MLNLKQFFKPTLAKILISLVLPAFYVIVDVIYCYCRTAGECGCPPPEDVYALRPLPWAIYLYIENFRRFGDRFYILYSILLGLLSAYLIACGIVFLVKKLKKHIN